MKRILSLVLVLLTVLSMLLSCGQEAAAPQDTTAAAETSPAESEGVTETQPKSGVPEDTDLDGAAIRIWYTTNWMGYTAFDGDNTGDTLDSAIYNQRVAVEDRLRCTIEYFDSNTDQAKCNEAIQKLLLAGDDSFDAYAPTQWNGVKVVAEGLFLNIADQSVISFDKPWWYAEYMAEMAVGKNCIFTLVGDWSIDAKRFLSCCYANKQIYGSSFGEPDELYGFVLDGSWTVDRMQEMCEAAYSDLDGNGKADKNDMLGTVLVWNEDILSLQVGSGERFTKRDSDNIPILNENFERMFTVCDRLYELSYNTTGIVYGTKKEALEIEENAKKFSSSTMLLMLGQFYVAEYLRDMTDDFAILPVPKFEESQSDYWSYMFEVLRFVALPYNCKAPDVVCAALEELAFEGHQSVAPVYYEESLKTKYLRDSQSSQMIDLISGSVYYDNALIYVTSWGSITIAARDLITSGKNTFASEFAARHDKAIEQGGEVIAQFLAFQ